MKNTGTDSTSPYFSSPESRPNSTRDPRRLLDLQPAGAKSESERSASSLLAPLHNKSQQRGYGQGHGLIHTPSPQSSRSGSSRPNLPSAPVLSQNQEFQNHNAPVPDCEVSSTTESMRNSSPEPRLNNTSLPYPSQTSPLAPPAGERLLSNSPVRNSSLISTTAGPGQPISELPGYAQALIPSLVGLADRIIAELEANIVKLLNLNPSRREAIALYLDRLAGHIPSADPSHPHPSRPSETAGGLLRWIQGPRSPVQDAALVSYFEEIALITLGQALVLKNWNDLGRRAWAKCDLSRINWAMSTALKPHVPHDRRGWQITQPNLYSWYNPSSPIQEEIWSVLDCWSQTRSEGQGPLSAGTQAPRMEGPHFLTSLFYSTRQVRGKTRPDVGLFREPEGFDWRFYQGIWGISERFGLPPSTTPDPLNRQRNAFSPTLRDGSVCRSGPSDLHWIGLENSPYQLMLAELALLWWSPASPPCWELGNGLEVHARDQLSLSWNSPKPSVLSRITEMEACDIAFIFEERCVRSQGRNPEAVRFKEQVEALPYFRKLRGTGTSLGALQACVALSKLRPGGLLWWAREEPLASHDGQAMLNFLLDRGELVCEWDFSDLVHHLPSSVALLPKTLYLFRRASNVESRLMHRPQKCVVHGQLRSHVEFPMLLRDVFEAALHKGASSTSPAGGTQPKARGSWQTQRFVSPTPQKEWTERWPDPLTRSSARALERLRSDSECLAAIATVRPTPDGDPLREMRWTVDRSLKGFWIQSETTPDGRRLRSLPLPMPGKEVSGAGCMILLSDDAWIAPLKAYLETPAIREWLELNSERKADRWVINEQLIKFLPIPKCLTTALNPAFVLNGDWEKTLAMIPTQPAKVKDQLKQFVPESGESVIKASCFVRATQARETLLQTQERILAMLSPQGEIRWRYFFDALPASELTGASLHAEIHLQGNLPHQVPIARFDRVKTPQPGILFSTESGYHLHVSSSRSMLLDMIWEQLGGLQHPTWGELTKLLRLPRRLEIIEATARKVLENHSLQSRRLNELNELIGVCGSLV